MLLFFSLTPMFSIEPQFLYYKVARFTTISVGTVKCLGVENPNTERNTLATAMNGIIMEDDFSPTDKRGKTHIK